jgi:hypothetical protein
VPYDNDGGSVSMRSALDAWEPHAVALLTDTASTYNGFVTYKQLGEAVQEQSGIRHNGLLTNWIGNLLARVIDHCVTAGTPQLGALCVKEDGTVGEGYRHAVLAAGSTNDELNLDQLDDHAAKTRLECYRHFGAELPPDGGAPTLTLRAKATRDRRNTQKKLEEPPKICPTCSLQLPAMGRCDDCA